MKTFLIETTIQDCKNGKNVETVILTKTFAAAKNVNTCEDVFDLFKSDENEYSNLLTRIDEKRRKQKATRDEVYHLRVYEVLGGAL